MRFALQLQTGHLLFQDGDHHYQSVRSANSMPPGTAEDRSAQCQRHRHNESPFGNERLEPKSKYCHIPTRSARDADR